MPPVRTLPSPPSTPHQDVEETLVRKTTGRDAARIADEVRGVATPISANDARDALRGAVTGVLRDELPADEVLRAPRQELEALFREEALAGYGAGATAVLAGASAVGSLAYTSGSDALSATGLTAVQVGDADANLDLRLRGQVDAEFQNPLLDLDAHKRLTLSRDTQLDLRAGVELRGADFEALEISEAHGSARLLSDDTTLRVDATARRVGHSTASLTAGVRDGAFSASAGVRATTAGDVSGELRAGYRTKDLDVQLRGSADTRTGEASIGLGAVVEF